MTTLKGRPTATTRFPKPNRNVRRVVTEAFSLHFYRDSVVFDRHNSGTDNSGMVLDLTLMDSSMQLRFYTGPFSMIPKTALGPAWHWFLENSVVRLRCSRDGGVQALGWAANRPRTH